MSFNVKNRELIMHINIRYILLIASILIGLSLFSNMTIAEDQKVDLDPIDVDGTIRGSPKGPPRNSCGGDCRDGVPKIPSSNPAEAPGDFNSLINDLATVFEFQNQPASVKAIFKDTSRLSLVAGGVQALIDFAKSVKDLNTIASAQNEINKYARKMEPDTLHKVVISISPEGVTRITQIDGIPHGVWQDGKSKYFETTIFNPPQISTELSKSEEQRKKELDDWYNSLDEEQKLIISKYKDKAKQPISKDPQNSTSSGNQSSNQNGRGGDRAPGPKRGPGSGHGGGGY